MLSGLFTIITFFSVNPGLKVLASWNYKKRMQQKAKNFFHHIWNQVYWFLLGWISFPSFDFVKERRAQPQFFEDWSRCERCARFASSCEHKPLPLRKLRYHWISEQVVIASKTSFFSFLVPEESILTFLFSNPNFFRSYCTDSIERGPAIGKLSETD